MERETIEYLGRWTRSTILEADRRSGGLAKVCQSVDPFYVDRGVGSLYRGRLKWRETVRVRARHEHSPVAWGPVELAERSKKL